MPAQPQQNITIPAPGAMGLNTEQSPTAQDGQFCLQADNAIIDQFGRIGSRKAFASYTDVYNLTYTVDPSTTTQNKEILAIESGSVAGNIEIVVFLRNDQFNAVGSLIQTDYFLATLDTVPGSVELNEITIPAFSDPSTLDKPRLVSFNEKFYLFTANNEAVVWDGTTAQKLFTGVADTDYIAPQDDTGVLASTINGNIATAAYGRLWVSGVNGNYDVVYYSDLLIGTQWYDGRATPADSQNTGGLIDMSEYWPTGSDQVRAIVAHNNSLFVFGRTSILVWGNPSGDPAATNGIFLQDTITNIGCVTQEALAVKGDDVLFVDDSGVRSLGRTIQEKSAPLGDLTANVRKDITNLIQQTIDKDTIRIDYWAEEALSVVTFPEQQVAYVLDMRGVSPTGGLKVTRWTDCVYNCAHYVELSSGSLTLLGSNNDNGVLRYRGYQSYDNQPYVFRYNSPGLTFGQPANLKFVKQIDYTCVSTFSEATATAKWSFDYEEPGRTKLIQVGATPPSTYGVSQYGVDIFGGAQSTIRRYKINGKGSGELLQVGINMDINGNSFSLQEVNLQTLLGRTL